MVTWNELRESDIREEILNEEMYCLVGKNLSNKKTHKVEALLINVEFAKTLGDDVLKILKELGVQ